MRWRIQPLYDKKEHDNLRNKGENKIKDTWAKLLHHVNFSGVYQLWKSAIQVYITSTVNLQKKKKIVRFQIIQVKFKTMR